jgi:hypothetical protein
MVTELATMGRYLIGHPLQQEHMKCASHASAAQARAT